MTNGLAPTGHDRGSMLSRPAARVVHLLFGLFPGDTTFLLDLAYQLVAVSMACATTVSEIRHPAQNCSSKARRDSVPYAQ